MSSDRRIQKAIQSGERNASGFTLVKNWCAHVRIERFGGVGMIEGMTGLPIGHHGLACDHAPAGGMMSWDIRDAALDFYDRYCRTCKIRKPVGVPNLGSWIAERDEASAKQRKNEADKAAELARKLADRRAKRFDLRMGLTPAASDVIDQLEELDVQRTRQLTTRLIETARLAPDAFSPTVVEHLFELLENTEHWFDEAGLKVLSILRAEPRRLVRCAMVCLKGWRATRSAASVLLVHLPLADEALITDVLPAIIEMASPSRTHFGSHRSTITPLVRLYRTFPKQVTAGLDFLLAQDPVRISLAARALEVLVKRDSTLTAHFARDLISIMVRAHWMPDPDDISHDANSGAARDLQNSIVAIFLCNPDTVDSLLQKFRAGASKMGETRIFSVYARALHTNRIRRNGPITSAHRIAFQRLLWEAPKTNNEGVFREIQQAISYDPYDLVDLAADEIDALLGAAILMDDRVVAFDAEQKPTNPTMLELMERSNRRDNLTGLSNCFVRWAAAGAAARDTPEAYLQVLSGLPEKQDTLAASMIKNSVAFMETATGLNAVLPTLYSALVGVSVRCRGNAANAVGEMPWRQHDNAPDLLLEAFLTTLSDPFVYVHQSAVLALDRFRLPSRFDSRIKFGLLNVLFAHAKNAQQQDLTLKCIELLASRYLAPKEQAGRLGAFFVELISKMPSWRISSDLRSLSRNLAHAEGIIDLLIAHLVDPEMSEYGEENVLEALANLPLEVVYAGREKLAKVPVGANMGTRFRVLNVVEILTRSNSWLEAEQLAAATVASIPSTVREASQRVIFELTHIAASFERALADGDHKQARASVIRWGEVMAIKEKNDRERAQRPDPLRDLRGST